MTLAQGVVGYTQYFTGLPWAVVLVHMFLATLLVVALTRAMVRLRAHLGLTRRKDPLGSDTKLHGFHKTSCAILICATSLVRMPAKPRPGVRTVTDAKALSAMANPFRSRMMDALKVDGPSTASALAARTGQAVGSASHHLKVLHEAGLVEEAPELAKDRRERWWRLVDPGTRWSRADFADDTAAVDGRLRR